MDRSLKLKKLEKARRHIAQGGETISRQRKLIAKLEATGYDTAMARHLLASFEGLQAMSVSEVDRLERELRTKVTMLK
jgi:Spy/CpxP family protein refolding chaperone